MLCPGAPVSFLLLATCSQDSTHDVAPEDWGPSPHLQLLREARRRERRPRSPENDRRSSHSQSTNKAHVEKRLAHSVITIESCFMVS
jgi:hypothetical protein